MNQETLCLVTAAARAAAFLTDDPSAQELEPPHPAFVAFRRLTYIWREDSAWHPLGDSFGLWLDFLRARGVTGVALDLDRPPGVIQTPSGDGGTSWRITASEEEMALHGIGSGDPLPTARSQTACTRRLRDALEAAVAAASSPMEREALHRALAVLDSPEDGSELSDIAWPHFILPERGYDLDARRLFAAAVHAWDAGDDPWPVQPCDAIMAVVNQRVQRAGAAGG